MITNAERLRIKESDRIAAMEAEIAKMGGNITSVDGTVTVKGGKLSAADNLSSHNDHRIAMALCVALWAQACAAVSAGQRLWPKAIPTFTTIY